MDRSLIESEELVIPFITDCREYNLVVVYLENYKVILKENFMEYRILYIDNLCHIRFLVENYFKVLSDIYIVSFVYIYALKYVDISN